jgi:hypothetical protein
MGGDFLDTLAAKYATKEELQLVDSPSSPSSSLPPSPKDSLEQQPQKTTRFAVDLSTPSTIIDFSKRSFAPSLPPDSVNSQEHREELKKSISEVFTLYYALSAV